MTDDLWRTAYRLLEQACEQPETDRAAWIESHAPAGPIRDMVLTMLLEMDLPDGDVPADTPAEAFEELSSGTAVGRFVVGRRLGRGGMGYVYAATDTELNRQVALKFFQPGKIGSASTVESLLAEAQAASALNHPNIVTVHEVLRTPREPVIVMELVEGRSLRELASAPHTVEDVAGWGLQIARGLAAAHAKGFVHRDIKPENLMLRGDGLLKILDFGLARKLAHGTPADDLPIGTIGYMSPEQLRGEGMTPATDIFSLGVVLWELAVGKHPFLADTTTATTRAIQAGDPAYHIPQGPLAPPIERLWRRLLSKEPAARPEAAEVVKLLSQLIEHRRTRRPRWIMASAAAACLLAGAALLVLQPAGREQTDPTVVTHFTTNEGSQTDPAFSPDGTRLAFAWTGESGRNRNIYVRRINSESVTPLTQGPAEDFAPAWSPDNTRIAFLRRPAGGGNPSVMIAPAQGGESRLAGPVVDPEGFPQPVAWWPDGNSLLVRDAGSRGFALTRLNLATGSKQPLTSPAADEADGLPVLSPDGQRFAFVRLRVNTASVCLLELRGEIRCIQNVVLQQGDAINGLIRGLAWRRDGKAIYYADKSGIWRLKLGRFAKPFELLEGSFEGLAGDPRADRLAFTRQVSEDKLWMIEPGVAPAHKLPGSNASEQEPTFSPDGKRLCFRSNRTGSFELWASNADGSEARKLTSFLGHLGSARYSPDGHWIAFDGYGSPSAKNNQNNIYVTPADGGPVRRVTDDRVGSFVPNWSHDQKWIYYIVSQHSTRETWKIPFPSGNPVRVAGYGMFDLWESDDGAYLYYTRFAGAPGIYRRRVAGGPEEFVPGTNAVETIRYWQPSLMGIFFASGTMDASVKLLDWKTNRVSAAYAAPGRLHRGPRGFAVSPDGSRIVYMREDLAMANIDFLEKQDENTKSR